MRVNRALRASHSRREVNRFISNGRLSRNGKVASNPDDRLSVGDIVRLDDQVIMWEEKDLPSHRYLKYHKPRGVLCTTDRRAERNIVDEVETSILRNSNINNINNCPENSVIRLKQRRVYPIGRLDLESSGLILLTSDGSIVNPLLRTDGDNNKRKEYHVVTEPMATDDNIIELCEGIVITTLARKEGIAGVPVSARTLPCLVERIGDNEKTQDASSSTSTLRFVITEGRNRQIRKMCSSLGLEVTNLHRVNFAGITLDGCERLGDCLELTKKEMILIGRGPTRAELRTPEERELRMLKKLNKRRKKI